MYITSDRKIMKRLRLCINIIPNAYKYHKYIEIISPTTLKNRPIEAV